MNFLNKTAYNDMILAQGDMVCFKIFEEANAKANKYGNSRRRKDENIKKI